MLSYTGLKPGTVFLKDGEPFKVLEYAFLRMQQRRRVARLKIKNLISNKVLDYTAHQTDEFEEAEIEVLPIRFLYNHRGEYWFSASDNQKERFSLSEEAIGGQVRFLKPNLEVKAHKFQSRIINIELPIKVELKVVEAPPGLKGNTAQGGTKAVVVETGAKIDVPLFINEGDFIRVNTATGEYAERTEKSS